MNERLQTVQHYLRHSGLLNVVEGLRFRISLLRHRSSNRAFRKLHPDFAVPPEHLAYDAYSAADWNNYYHTGISTAGQIAELVQKYLGQRDPIRVFEWGCGPGRSIRHLPRVLGPSAEVFGTDYNPETIAWCSKNIPNVRFAKNELLPPLPFAADFFDLINAMSVFTHLSEEVCRAWIDEISRVLNTGAIAYFTTKSGGDARFLLPHELKEYQEKGVVVRGKVQEGKKMYGTWHHPDYVKRVMLANYELLEHRTPGVAGGQDFWVARKRAPAEK